MSPHINKKQFYFEYKNTPNSNVFFVLKVIILLVVFLSFFCNDSFSNVNFYSINSLYNVSMRQTSSVCKDENGFVWTSSKTGVMRIGDNNVKFYDLPYNSANVWSVRLSYSSNKLIVYSNNGQIFQYDKIYDEFVLSKDLRELLDDKFIVVNSIISDSEGSLLVACSNGLHKVSEDFVTNIDSINAINCISNFEEDEFIFASDNKIFVYNIQTGTTKLFYTLNNENITIQYLYFDTSTNFLWIGTMSDGLRILDVDNNQLLDVSHLNFPKQPILKITKNKNDSFLIGIDGQGIWELSLDGKNVINKYKHNEDNPFSLNGDGVYDIFCDDEKVWVATHSDGVSYFEQKTSIITSITHQINTPNSLVNNNINGVTEDIYGNIWFATNNGISCWDIKTNKWTNFYNDTEGKALVFLSVCGDSKGRIWAGSYSSGFYVIDAKSKKEIIHYSSDNQKGDFTCDFVMSIFEDSEGDVWVGGSTRGDILCYFTKENKFEKYVDQPVVSFGELEKGKILLSCTYGLILLDKYTQELEYLLIDYIAQDVSAEGDDIWIATGGDGVINYNHKNKNLKFYQVKDGLLSNFVNSIIKINNQMWVGTENGLSQIEIKKDSTTVFNYSASQLNKSFNLSAKCLLKNGNLILGTNGGAVSFNPNNLDDTYTKGEIFIQDIYISGISIRKRPEILKGIEVDNQSEIVLKYNLNNISFDLLPIKSSNLNRVKFSWMLEGVDTQWGLPIEQSNINYANIPNGKFNLKIRMYDDAFSKIIDERDISIIVKAPFWKTLWFNVLGVLAFTVILFLIIKIYINQINQKHSKDKIEFFTNIAHDLRTSLTLIAAPIDEISRLSHLPSKAEYYIKLAVEQSKRLLYVTTQLLDFQKTDVGKEQMFPSNVDIVELVLLRKSMFESSAKIKNIDFNFISNVDVYHTAIDEMKIEKVIDNLLSNAIKYSYENSQIDIIVDCNENRWNLEIKDYGLGISEKVQKKLFKEFYRGENIINSKLIGSGIGLLIVKSYVEMHNGTVGMSSIEGKGTSFIISIPYKSSDVIVDEDLKAEDRKSKTTSEVKQTKSFRNEAKVKNDINILVVEDNKDLQNFIVESLKEFYHISTADDGEIAWNMIRKEEPDLIISDIMMPNLDGLELCRILKYTVETSHIPIILLTALSDEAQELEGLGVGADDYIIKPFNVSILLLRIKNILKNREVIMKNALAMFDDKNISKKPVLKNELNDEFVKKAINVVMNNIKDVDFLKDDFAKKMEMSLSLLYKKLKALTNQSPSDFIKIVRLNHSIELLRTGRFSITEISKMCGFSSVGYYSYAFKKHFEESPTEYIK